jgi:hypothetical protein
MIEVQPERSMRYSGEGGECRKTRLSEAGAEIKHLASGT